MCSCNSGNKNMPDLEKRIADWRAGMLAAGIHSPETLDELEGHLREDMECEMKAGADEDEAFHRAAARLGPASTLHEEFAKAGGEVSAGERRVNRILGAGLTAVYVLLSIMWLQ